MQEDIKVAYQGVDTLRTAHIIKDDLSYKKYEEILTLLDNKKSDAILANANYEFEHGIEFEFFQFGKFFIRPKGQSRYKYVIYNEDIEIYFSTVKCGANDFNTPQIVIDFRAKFLTILGYKDAFSVVTTMLEKLLFSKTAPTYETIFKTRLQRIDLATDISGFEYRPIDKFRFQSLFKTSEHLEFKEHIQYNRLTGFSFGKGDFMIRIYNKSLEIERSGKQFLKEVWKNNADIEDDSVIYRHEVQFRRPYIKEFMKVPYNNEVLYFFKRLPSLWAFGISKINYVPIDDKKVLKIMNNEYKPTALKLMFYRAKKDLDNPLWDTVKTWRGTTPLPPQKYKNIKDNDYKQPIKFLKAFLSTSYKASRGNPVDVLHIFDLAQKDLAEKHGLNMHEYGSLKKLSSFIDNAQVIKDYGLVVNYDYAEKAVNLYAGLQKRFIGLDIEPFERVESRLASLFNTTKEDLRENINDYLNGLYLEEHNKKIEMEFII